MPKVNVVKSFKRVISRDYQSCEFYTQIGKDFEIKSKEDLDKAATALFSLAYKYTREDMLKAAETGLLQASEVPAEFSQLSGGTPRED